MSWNNRDGAGAARARGFLALFAVLAMGLGLMSWPAAAAPFLYVANTNSSPGVVSLIDTATNTRVPGGILAGKTPFGIAVAPDGLHVYVTNPQSNTVSVADTATNKKVVAITVGTYPVGVAVTPDGTHAYVTNTRLQHRLGDRHGHQHGGGHGHRWGLSRIGVAVTPDGTHVYVTNQCLQHRFGDRHGHQPSGGHRFRWGWAPSWGSRYPGWEIRLCRQVFIDNTVLVIATASNTVVGSPIPGGDSPEEVAVTPDGTHVYVANFGLTLALLL